jgi:hypothetical protein
MVLILKKLAKTSSNVRNLVLDGMFGEEELRKVDDDSCCTYHVMRSNPILDRIWNAY